MESEPVGVAQKSSPNVAAASACAAPMINANGNIEINIEMFQRLLMGMTNGAALQAVFPGQARPHTPAATQPEKTEEPQKKTPKMDGLKKMQKEMAKIASDCAETKQKLADKEKIDILEAKRAEHRKGTYYFRVHCNAYSPSYSHSIIRRSSSKEGKDETGWFHKEDCVGQEKDNIPKKG